MDYNAEGIAIEYDPSNMFLLGQQTLKPAQLLWLALLTDALEEIGIVHKEPQRNITWRMWKGTCDWILSSDETWVGSFNRVVRAIGWSPIVIRTKILSTKCRCCDTFVLLEPCKRVVKPKRKSDVRKENQYSRIR